MRWRRDKDQHAAGRAARGEPGGSTGRLPGSEPADTQTAEARPETVSTTCRAPVRTATSGTATPTWKPGNDRWRAKGMTAMKRWQDRIVEPEPGTRPPEYVIELWVSQEMRERARRNAAALAESIQAEKKQKRQAGRKQNREAAQPELEDREAE